MVFQILPKRYYDLKAKTIAPIRRRIPYTLSDTLNVAASGTNVAFNANSFLNNVGMPFEIHSLAPQAAFIDGSNNPVVSFSGTAYIVSTPNGASSAANYMSISVRDSSANVDILVSQLLNSLVDQDTGVWAFPRPYYLAPTFAWIVKASNTNTGQGIQAQVALRGALLVLGDPIPAPPDYVDEDY